MTLGPSKDQPEDSAAEGQATGAGHDPTIVPGMGGPVPAPREDPGPGLRRVQPLDMSKDPDRFDPDRADQLDPVYQPTVVGPLDMAQDPDRMPRPGEGQSLTDLIGKQAAQEDERDNYEWAIGLLAVLTFLGLVAFFFSEVVNY
jgi:hypothetical protein